MELGNFVYHRLVGDAAHSRVCILGCKPAPSRIFAALVSATTGWVPMIERRALTQRWVPVNPSTSRARDMAVKVQNESVAV
jgi:hypothetical protein